MVTVHYPHIAAAHLVGEAAEAWCTGEPQLLAVYGELVERLAAWPTTSRRQECLRSLRS